MLSLFPMNPGSLREPVPVLSGVPAVDDTRTRAALSKALAEAGSFAGNAIHVFALYEGSDFSLPLQCQQNAFNLPAIVLLAGHIIGFHL